MSVIFQPGQIKNLELKNRLVRSATHEGMADESGLPTEKHFKLYSRLAQGGVGLIITGYAYVSPDGQGFFPGMNGIHSDACIPGYRALVDEVHDSGGKIAMQIAHSGRQTTRRAIGARPMAPSAIKDKSLFETPREMTARDIERVIEDFAKAARRVRECGFDAVQLHAAHGYLLSSFLCPHTNRRRDEWGGSIDNRMRIIEEIYRKSRELVGNDYPVLIKMNAMDNMPGGLNIEESLVMAQMMAKMGFDGIEVSCGIGEDRGSSIRGDLPVDVVLDSWEMYKNKNPLFRFIMGRYGTKLMPPVPFSENYNLESAAMIKEKVDVPVFAVGGLVDPASMEKAITDGRADYISLSRPLIADPGFPNKIKEGRTEISRCIHCNLCLFYLPVRPLACYHGKRLKKRD